MRNSRNILGALAAVSALMVGNAMAEVEYEIHTGYSNEYLFRGLNLGHNLIETGADVSAAVQGFGLAAGAWYGAFQDNAVPGLGSPNQDASELDIYGQASRDFGWCSGSIGYIYRYFDSNDNTLNTQELHFGLSRRILGIDTSLVYFWGLEGDNNGYSELALAKHFSLSGCVTLNCGTALGYLVEQGQLTALTSKLSLDWGFARSATLSPFVKWSIALSDDSNTAYYGSKNQLVGGMLLSVTF